MAAEANYHALPITSVAPAWQRALQGDVGPLLTEIYDQLSKAGSVDERGRIRSHYIDTAVALSDHTLYAVTMLHRLFADQTNHQFYHEWQMQASAFQEFNYLAAIGVAKLKDDKNYARRLSRKQVTLETISYYWGLAIPIHYRWADKPEYVLDQLRKVAKLDQDFNKERNRWNRIFLERRKSWVRKEKYDISDELFIRNDIHIYLNGGKDHTGETRPRDWWTKAIIKEEQDIFEIRYDPFGIVQPIQNGKTWDDLPPPSDADKAAESLLFLASNSQMDPEHQDLVSASHQLQPSTPAGKPRSGGLFDITPGQASVDSLSITADIDDVAMGLDLHKSWDLSSKNAVHDALGRDLPPPLSGSQGRSKPVSMEALTYGQIASSGVGGHNEENAGGHGLRQEEEAGRQGQGRAMGADRIGKVEAEYSRDQSQSATEETTSHVGEQARITGEEEGEDTTQEMDTDETSREDADQEQAGVSGEEEGENTIQEEDLDDTSEEDAGPSEPSRFRPVKEVLAGRKRGRQSDGQEEDVQKRERIGARQNQRQPTSKTPAVKATRPPPVKHFSGPAAPILPTVEYNWVNDRPIPLAKRKKLEKIFTDAVETILDGRRMVIELRDL